MKKALWIMFIITVVFISTIIGIFVGRRTTDGNLKIHARESIRQETVDEEETQTSGPININTADSELLQELPGVGKTTAEAIIAYREENGPFKTKKEIMEVKGIGEKTYEELKSLITVED